METGVGASQNIVRGKFILIRADGFATPMETGVIMNTTAGQGIRIGSTPTTTTTATDKLGNPPNALGPAGCGAHCCNPLRLHSNLLMAQKRTSRVTLWQRSSPRAKWPSPAVATKIFLSQSCESS